MNNVKSPSGLAVLEFLWGLVGSAILTAVTAAGQFVSANLTNAKFSFIPVLIVFALTFVSALVDALVKLGRASKEPVVVTVADAAQLVVPELQQVINSSVQKQLQDFKVAPAPAPVFDMPSLAVELMNLLKGTQSAPTPAPAPVRQNTQPPTYASSSPAPAYQQAPVMPMNIPVNVSQLQTAQMPAVQAPFAQQYAPYPQQTSAPQV